MRIKVERISAGITETLKSWPGIEAVVLCETSENDVLDPYFALGLDAYTREEIPDSESRREAFDDPGAFESSTVHMKDRFFIEGLPVHIDYKPVQDVDELVEGRGRALANLAQSGTYALYRLEHGRALYNRSDWLAKAMEGAKGFPAEAWDVLREAYQTRMEHFLSDLGAAALKDDAFFYLLSIAGFLKSAGQTIFALNRQFEPSSRSFTERLDSLPRLPEGFAGKWDSLLGSEIATNRRRVFEIAQHVALSIVRM